MSYSGQLHDDVPKREVRCPICGRRVEVGKKDKIAIHNNIGGVCAGSELKATRHDLRGWIVK